MSRFFVSPADIDGANIRVTDKRDIHHMTEVLRLGAGDEIIVSDSTGWDYICEIASCAKDEIVCRICDKMKDTKEPLTKITLFQGVPKGQKLDDTVRKTTELGISCVVPVFMKRTVVKDNGSYSKKCDRFRAIALEASKQSGRGVVPEISDAVSFDEMIRMLERFDLVVFCYENEDKQTLKDVLRDLDERPRTAALIIGPEGGFSDDEAEKLISAGCSPASLGRTILRTETAGTAALAMMLYELEL